ncbi:hypothetical protein B0T16DRAFT_445421 [Cercophora newfieldiana]|uniref:Zn(2)-C6 fungal-type domain-containing protein n=1 Tax=Cercophora newfieldiana TaxID=92897 RepID=A0AA40CT50_9PEZI|nr:hypothetical protein B0T16DRAFT_445421 [Cercophora newfieldiana]
MDGSVPRKRNVRRTKVKTGCATCRIRKIKCDETKPFCKKCVDTGRTCDGYDSPFRFHPSQTPNNTAQPNPQPVHPSLAQITPDAIDLLNACFSTKTIFDGVKLDCDEEARQVLQASLTNPSIQHAVSSLKALRHDLEAPAEQQTPSYDYGLQQYCMALGGLASNLSSPGIHELKSALLCCQVFISIEQARANYGAMAQHMIKGLGILREARAKSQQAAPTNDKLPSLDVFIIKLFAAPCKYSEAPTTPDTGRTPEPVYMTPPYEQGVEAPRLRKIAPDNRAELLRISTSTLEFLDKVSLVTTPAGSVPQLQAEKTSLLSAMESWVEDLDAVHAGSTSPEPLSISFLRYFHQALKVVLIGTLSTPSDLLRAEIQTENGRLQGIADDVTDRVKAYFKMCGKTGSGLAKV